MTRSNGFDKLARLYRWMEYLSFGPLLWRTRTAFLPRMRRARHVLVLGDGDGRFTAALLRNNDAAVVHAVDASGAMLDRLRRRAVAQGDGARLRTLHADATATLPADCFDLVCSHFFLDCLDDAQCRALAARVAAQMNSAACWVVSEFAVPQGRWRWPARVLVRGLYAAFALLTGLRVQHLPNHAAALREAGLACIAVQTRLGGILRAEIWTAATERSSPEVDA
ncbi:class I SAM-dependent methyltransferase [Terriglobus sp.]|uniref:class I SAM-dependent methyltransferase n=1 Tax=Terriglobus sp. TaxID=1889013 RepID=UPI003B00D846